MPINPELTQDIYSCPQALPPPEHLNKGGECSLTDLFLQGLQGLHAGPLCTLECSDQLHRGVVGDHSRVGSAPLYLWLTQWAAWEEADPNPSAHY